MYLKNQTKLEDGTILLWVIGIFSVSLLVLAALLSITTYFSNAMEWQSKVELAMTNASDKIDLSDFEISGELGNIRFDSDNMLTAVLRELGRNVTKPERIDLQRWEVEGQQVWIQVAYPWKSPLGEFDVLPENLVAKVHLTIDSNRHLQ